MGQKELNPTLSKCSVLSLTGFCPYLAVFLGHCTDQSIDSNLYRAVLALVLVTQPFLGPTLLCLGWRKKLWKTNFGQNKFGQTNILFGKKCCPKKIRVNKMFGWKKILCGKFFLAKNNVLPKKMLAKNLFCHKFVLPNKFVSRQIFFTEKNCIGHNSDKNRFEASFSDF